MKIRELEAFDAYMKLGTMKAASEELGISQPMISRLLSKLEIRVKFALFDKKRNQLKPTPEAHLYHQSVARLISQVRENEQDAAAIANNQLGNVIIAAQPTFVDTLLLDALRSFNVKHPGIGIKVLDVGMRELLRTIDKNYCDVALGITLESGNYSAKVRPLGRCEARCIMHEDHPLAREELISAEMLRGQDFIDLMPESPLRKRVDELVQTESADRRTVAEMGTMRGVCALVDRGMGVAVVDPFAELLLRGTSVVSKRLTPLIEWEVVFLTPDNVPTSRVAEALFSEIEAEVDRLKGMGILKKDRASPGL
ncbi:LysR family transcriptional regulator [Roseivivax sediminis]|uniref:DNA-binding transcriptional regulator, LysR family n=1 Tax=Roseivivax sediminis TaxID=936889 RepID=A0A1I1V9Y8_9RHOB|nr:LysR family transcriptional regulator [Roseivivax sediminis]SFD79911.1 DNA-binding transcriptional regulator, LysR family [Roseivivax sediminis]